MPIAFDEARTLLLTFPGAAEDFPFGPETHVFKVAGKVFAIMGADDGRPANVSLKCDPDLAPLLRERYAAVVPGYHLNKAHWNTVLLDGSVPDEELGEWVAMSYDLVVAGLSRAVRAGLGVR